MSDIKELPIEEQLKLYQKGEIDASEIDVKKIPIQNPLDGFNEGCLLVIMTLEGFMEDMDAKKEGMYQEKYDKVKRMLSGMKATVGDRIDAGKQSDIEVPSQKIILPI